MRNLKLSHFLQMFLFSTAVTAGGDTAGANPSPEALDTNTPPTAVLVPATTHSVSGPARQNARPENGKAIVVAGKKRPADGGSAGGGKATKTTDGPVTRSQTSAAAAGANGTAASSSKRKTPTIAPATAKKAKKVPAGPAIGGAGGSGAGSSSRGPKLVVKRPRTQGQAAAGSSSSSSPALRISRTKRKATDPAKPVLVHPDTARALGKADTERAEKFLRASEREAKRQREEIAATPKAGGSASGGKPLTHKNVRDKLKFSDLRNKKVHEGLTRLRNTWRAVRTQSGAKAKDIQGANDAIPNQIYIGKKVNGSDAETGHLSFAKPLDFIGFSFFESRAVSKAGVGNAIERKQIKIANSRQDTKASVGDDYDSLVAEFDAGGRQKEAADALLAILDASIVGVDDNDGTIRTDLRPDDKRLDWLTDPKLTDSARAKRHQAVSLFIGITQVAEGDGARNSGLQKAARAAVRNIQDTGSEFKEAFARKDGDILVSWATQARAALGGTAAGRGTRILLTTGKETGETPKAPARKNFLKFQDDASESSEDGSQ